MIRALLFSIFFLVTLPLQATPQKTVNLYGWAYVFPPEILVQFQKETGIKVNLDVYDTPEIMETSLKSKSIMMKVTIMININNIIK